MAEIQGLLRIRDFKLADSLGSVCRLDCSGLGVAWQSF